MRGGFRAGAGRKQGISAKNAELAREILSAYVLEELKPIALALIQKAKNGDVPAIRELFDRAFGKATHIPSEVEQDLPHPILVSFIDTQETGCEISAKSHS